MLDKERISLIISEIEHYSNEIEKIGIKTEKDLDTLRFPAVSMLLLSLINKVIDLGEEIIAGNKLEMPKSYRDVFRILGKNRLINKDLSRNTQLLVKYRNILAHEYGTLYEKDVIFLLKRLRYIKDFEKIAKRML